MLPADTDTHVSGATFADVSFRFAQVGDREGDGTIWIELVRAGTHHSGTAGGAAASGQKSIEITQEWIASAQRGTAQVLADGRYPTGIPVRLDPEHSDKSLPATGRIKETTIATADDGRPCWLARVAWSQAAVESITAGEYDSVSIEAEPPGKLQRKDDGAAIEDWALTGLVITNHPFIAGMEPLAASESGVGLERDMKQITQALSLAEDAGESVVLAEIETLKASAAKVPALEESIETLTSDRDAVKAERDALKTSERTRALDDACAVGRIDASERERYAKVLDALGETEANAIFNEGRVKVAPTAKTGGDAANRSEAPSKTADDLFQDTYSRLLAEGKDEATAMNMAFAEHGPALSAAFAAERN